jgi:hypothetical protein
MHSRTRKQGTDRASNTTGQLQPATVQEQHWHVASNMKTAKSSYEEYF